jgi:hypothetical protein
MDPREYMHQRIMQTGGYASGPRYNPVTMVRNKPNGRTTRANIYGRQAQQGNIFQPNMMQGRNQQSPMFRNNIFMQMPNNPGYRMPNMTFGEAIAPRRRSMQSPQYGMEPRPQYKARESSTLNLNPQSTGSRKTFGETIAPRVTGRRNREKQFAYLDSRGKPMFHMGWK